MSEKITFLGAGIVIGAVIAFICTGIVWRGRAAGEIAELNRRIDQLNREYTERQRELENNVGQCLEFVDTAGTIAERTGENAGRAIGNLREAVDLIRQGIAEREALKMEFDNLRTALYRIRDMGGQFPEQMSR